MDSDDGFNLNDFHSPYFITNTGLLDETSRANVNCDSLCPEAWFFSSFAPTIIRVRYHLKGTCGART